jgi:hypothetical protein
MSQQSSHLAWVKGYLSRREGDIKNTYVADYRLQDLMQKGFINRQQGQAFFG